MYLNNATICDIHKAGINWLIACLIKLKGPYADWFDVEEYLVVKYVLILRKSFTLEDKYKIYRIPVDNKINISYIHLHELKNVIHSDKICYRIAKALPTSSWVKLKHDAILSDKQILLLKEKFFI